MKNTFSLERGMTVLKKLAKRCVLAAAGAACLVAYADDSWPNKPIRMIVPVSAGSATDLLARQMAPRVSALLGQPIVIENRAGADMAIGIGAVARSPADGYTWLMVSSGLTSGAVLKKVPFDPVKDFSPVTLMGYASTVAVVPKDSGIRSLQEFIQLAKAQPGALNYAFPAIGTLGHLHSVMLEHATGIRLGPVPYKGSSLAMTDLLANRVQFMMAPPGVALPYVNAGSLIALGVGGAERSPLYPDVPTLTEQGIEGVELEAWLGLVMPANTPQEIIQRVDEAVKTVLQDPAARTAAEQAAIRVAVSESPEAFAALIRQEMQMWPQVFEMAQVPTENAAYTPHTPVAN